MHSLAIAHGEPHLQVIPFTTQLWSVIGSDWDALLLRCRSSSAFMSSAWIRRWLAVFGDTMRPDTLIWRDGNGAVVAICLLTIRRERRGPFTVRRAYLNATGEHQVASEHNIILCFPDCASFVSASVIAYVRARRVDSIMMSGFGSDSIDCIERLWPTNGIARGFASEDRFVALDALRTSGASYDSSLSRSTREQIRRSIRIYTKEYGEPIVEVAGSPQVAEDWLVQLRALHQQRWNARGQGGAFATKHVMEFHTMLVRENGGSHGEANELRVDLVRVRFGDTVIGLLYNLCTDGCISFYQSGLLYSDDNRCKPGLVTHALTIQHYLNGDASEYDFLAGDPSTIRYKESLGPQSRKLFWREFMFPTLKMRLIERLRALRPQRIAGIGGESGPAE